MLFAVVDWGKGRNRQQLRIYDTEGGPAVRYTIDMPPGLGLGAVADVLVYPLGYFFFVGFLSGEVYVINRAGKYKLLVSRPGLLSMALSPDGKLLALSSALGITIWNLPALKEDRRVLPVAIIREQLGGIPSGLRFDKYGERLLVGGSSQLMYLFNTGTGKEIQCFEGHTSDVCSVVYADESRVISAGGQQDGTVRVWDVATGAEMMRSPRISGEIITLEQGPDETVFVGTAAGIIEQRDLADGGRCLQEYTIGATLSGLIYAPPRTELLAGASSGSVVLFDIGEIGFAAPIQRLVMAPYNLGPVLIPERLREAAIG